MLHLYIGVDRRQPIAGQVLAHSIYTRASKPVSITMLHYPVMPIKRRGLSDFTYARYCVPFLSGYKGRSIFMDADMLCLADVHDLLGLADPLAAVSVVKNKMRFEWTSLMVFNNAACLRLTPEWIDHKDTAPQSLSWAGEVGELPSEWNHLVGYDAQRADAKLVHFTQGIPVFPEVEDCEYSEEWRLEHRAMNSTVSWKEIMGDSVHAQPVIRRLIDSGKMSLVQSTAQH